MPIRPENKERYPADWTAISLATRERAKWRCECEGECGRGHRERCEKRQGDELPERLASGADRRPLGPHAGELRPGHP